MSKLKLGELFAGFGGLGMAVEEVFDAELTWYAEFDDAPSKIMAHHWPGIPNHRDVTTVDWASVEPVDIISGGSPCQDLSAAGRRAGMTEGTRSNLWVSMREAIATIKPTYVVWENVRGAYSAKASSASDLEPRNGSMGVGAGDNLRALGRVLGDLADLGYDCQWRGLRAADVGAPHGRYRVFILATRRDATNTLSERSRESLGGQTRIEGAEIPQPHHRGTPPTNTNDERGDGSRSEREENRRGESTNGGDTATNSESRRRGNAHTDDFRPASGEINTPRNNSDASSGTPGTSTNWGVYAPAIARWEASRGTAPAPTELTAKGKHRLSAGFAEWMMGLDPGHVTAVPGLTRNEELKAIGNGVVPQQATAALKHMLGAS